MPTITSKGQVTVPKRIRETLGLRPGSQVDFLVEDDRVVLRPHGIPAEVFAKWRGYAKDRLQTKEAVDSFLEDIRGERLTLDEEPPSDL